MRTQTGPVLLSVLKNSSSTTAVSYSATGGLHNHNKITVFPNLRGAPQASGVERLCSKRSNKSVNHVLWVESSKCVPALPVYLLTTGDTK